MYEGLTFIKVHRELKMESRNGKRPLSAIGLQCEIAEILPKRNIKSSESSLQPLLIARV